MRVESARNLFALTYAASLAYVAGTLGRLPDAVASSFGAGGAAQAFMPRTAYAILFVGLSASLPLLLVAAFAWLPRRFSRFVNVPNRGQWITPALSAVLYRRLALAGYLLAGTAAVFLAAMHALLLEANTLAPPRLAQGPFIALMLAFVACTLGASLGLALSLRRPPAPGARD